MRAFFTVLFFAAVVFLPWYASVPLGIILIAYWGAYVEAIVGGVVLDALFGAPIASLHGFACLYTALFIILSLFAFVLRRLMIE